MLQLLKPACLEPVLCNKRSHCDEKPARSNEDPTQPEKNPKNFDYQDLSTSGAQDTEALNS